MKERTDPANIPPWADGQFVGSPETVRGRVAAYVEGGLQQLPHPHGDARACRAATARPGSAASRTRWCPYFTGGEALRAAAGA